ncbi:MAG: transcription-repair coupling factor [Gammaproteobacteria bacterium]|nr:transcription-repair coupling factor [Gammaproteobacteria bacterium]MBK83865.1 transcription-repair coupling factor [Gammaproteobacteria bacterium]|tara:strand:+ start:4504 stop:7992 length:3489 start_codon:yes stop_codon:yes gene_type:complete
MHLETAYIPNGTGDRKRWGKITTTSLACAIADNFLKSQEKNESSFWLIVAPNTSDAYRLYSELPFFMPEHAEQISLFPDWEILPYDSFSPHEDIISERLSTLSKLPTQKEGILIVAMTTLCHKLSPSSFISANSLELAVGDIVEPESLRHKFSKAGYRNVDNVYEHGEFAIRGSILDVFPMGMNTPVRLEFFDNEIETLRLFDPESQRSGETLQEIKLLPGREFPLTDSSIRTFKAQWLEEFGKPPSPCQIYDDIDNGLVPGGIEYYIPLFFDETSSLIDYIPEHSKVVMPVNFNELLNQFYKDTEKRYDDYNIDRRRPLLPPSKILLREHELNEQIADFPAAQFTQDEIEEKAGRINFSTSAQSKLEVNYKAAQPWQALLDFVTPRIQSGFKVVLMSESPGRREFLNEKLRPIFKKHNIGEIKVLDGWPDVQTADYTIAIMVGPLVHGLSLDQDKICVICEHQLFSDRVAQTRRRSTNGQQINPDHIIRDLTELRIGAPVVHIDHGVGRYEGLQTMDLGGQPQEFCTLAYANDTKLYVPVSSLHCIARYTGGDEETAPLHKLGNDRWSNERKKAAEKAKDVAAELLQIYANRAIQSGFAYPFDQESYDSFAQEFPFEPTMDQESAFQSVIHDMIRKQPMDRLICGDVGFGKTEVAMRAAFIAAHGGKQVALLVPTTLLAQQHYESLRDRFAQWPVRIEVISRFKTAKEQNAILEDAAQGKIDILVGTHKLLQPSVKFANLGLIIVDEEHRFGVKHKEALKKMRANLDVMTMTATPIPRTLNMSLAGMRDISIIATPPSKRLAVKTFVRESSNAIRKEAILRELLRGGQVFYLHNEIKSIFSTAEQISQLVPEAKVIVAHGQMRERELEKVMSDFYHQRFNVLVCTTIVETGIDIPTANTIIIDRADHFGLAQLHQLRGRVGRSHHQAYAYLLAPPVKGMTKDAVKRLEAIQEADTLGAGFTLASHDLEIRGAGELLGDEQSGHIQTVGYSMFMDMLNRAIKAIKKGEIPNLDQPLDVLSEINLHIPAVIPETYIPDPQTRLILYKRVASAQTTDELDELKIEFIDRFGTLPQPFINLFEVTTIKLLAQTIGARKIDISDKGGRIEFNTPPLIDPMKLIKLIQTRMTEFKLRGSDTLGIIKHFKSAEEKLEWLKALMLELAP